MKAWHFVGETLRDGRPVPPDGEWLIHDGELVICESGLHASKKLLDALRYAPGNTICRVIVDGDIIKDDDKLVATKRKILWRIDGEQVLRAFARWCALQIVNLWETPDIVMDYLLTGREEIRDAARAASWDATWAATWDAAGYAAGSAAWDATWDAAGYAAGSAAWNATRDAARAASWDAAWAVQDKQLEKMVHEAHNGRTEWVFDIPESEE